MKPSFWILGLVISVGVLGASPERGPGIFNLGSVSWSAWLGQALMGAVKAPPAAAKKAPEKPAPTPKPAEKLKVVLVCYNSDRVMEDSCRNMEKLLAAKNCPGVELQPTLEEPGEADIKKYFTDKKLPKGTIVLVSGHAADIAMRTGDVDPVTKKKKFWVEPWDEWVARLQKGDDLKITRGNGLPKLPGKSVRKAIESSAEDAALWFSICGAGGICQPTGCVGGACQATEITKSVRSLGWLDPPTHALISLLCSPKLREEADGSVDKKKDGRIDSKEIEKFFRCDAKKYPAAFTQHVYPTREFGNSLPDDISEAAKKEKIEAHMKERDEWAIQNAVQYLGQYLFYSPDELPDNYDKKRAKILQASYRKALVAKGIYDEKREVLDLKKLRPFLKVETKVESTGYHIVTVSLPQEDGEPTCYWSGLDNYFPDVDSFSLPSH